MPRDKTKSHERVVKAAMEEFLEKGFEEASMRSIGEKAGMTPAGLYRHYKSKEDMFEALVEPAITAFNEAYTAHVKEHYNFIDNRASKEEIFSSTEVDFMRDVVYPHYDEFRLLLLSAQGTKYSNFVHDLVRIQQHDFMKALEYMKSKGMNVKDISEDELHMLLSAYTTALLEPIAHNVPKEEAEHCFKIIEDFFLPGWQNLMGY